MEEDNFTFSESEIAPFLHNIDSSPHQFMFNLIGSGPNYINSQPVEDDTFNSSQRLEQQLPIVNDNHRPVQLETLQSVRSGEISESVVAQAMTKPADNTDGFIRVQQDVVEPAKDENFDGMMAVDQDEIMITGGDDSDKVNSSPIDDSDIEDEDKDEDDEDRESYHVMGPLKRSKPLKHKEFSKKLHDRLEVCHRDGIEIREKFPRLAVKELAGYMYFEGAGHGLDYKEFYEPFEQSYPALVTQFTVYCKRKTNKKNHGKTLKTSYFRAAVKSRLSKLRLKHRNEMKEERLIDGVLSNSAIFKVAEEVPVRGKVPCEAAQKDFGGVVDPVVLHWISGFQERLSIIERDSFRSSLFRSNGALLDFTFIKLELKLLLGLRKYKIFRKNAATFMDQCKKVENHTVVWDVLKAMIARFETKITKQDVIIMKKSKCGA